MSGRKLNAHFIKRIAQFEIYKTRNPNYERQYIIWNTNFDFENGHSHVFTLHDCESITQNIINGRLPVRKYGWKKFNDLIISHIRLTDDEVYINHLINIANDRSVLEYKHKGVS